MRKILLTLLSLLVLPVVGQGQVIEHETALFGAVRYDKIDDVDGEIAIGGGLAKHLGSGLWSMSYVDVGAEQKSLSLEFAFVPVSGDTYIGILAGPNVDWQAVFALPLEERILAYITGAAGLMAGHNFAGRWGLTGIGKYNFKLDEDSQTLYKSGWTAGLSVNYWLN